MLSVLDVGLSNILDSELIRRKPVERPHGEIVGAAVMNSELPGKVVERVKTVTGIETFLILPVTSLHLVVVAGRVGADEFVPYAQFRSSGFKESWQIPLAVGKYVLCSGYAARKRKRVNSSMAVYWNKRSSESAIQPRGTTFTST